MKTPFNNPKPVIVAIVALLVLFVSYKSCAGEMEIGATFTGEFNGGVGLLYSARALDDRVDFGIHIIGEQSWDGNTVANND